MTSAEHTGHATDRARRCVVFFLLACIASGSVLAGTAIGAEAARTTNSGPAAIPTPFAQADDESDDDGDDGEDEETRVINITAPGDDVEYTLTAPGLAPGDNLELANDDDESDAPQEVIDGDTATGVIGNDKHDSYGFTGSIDEVRLESEGIDKMEVRIDGEPVDPRALTDEETETTTATAAETMTTQETATETTTATAAETTTATPGTPATTTLDRETTRATSTDTASSATDATGTDASTTTPPPSTETTAGSEAASGQSGFGMVIFVLIGIVSGLILAGALVYVVGSDRFG